MTTDPTAAGCTTPCIACMTDESHDPAPTPSAPAGSTERRERYATAIRDRIKERTFPPGTGAAATFGATEFDMADAAMAVADTEQAAETAHLRQLLATENKRANDAIDREETAEQAVEEARADLPDRLRATLTERFTALGNPYAEMRRNEKGPDGWPASHPLGPNDVAEVLRELLTADEAQHTHAFEPDAPRAPGLCTTCGDSKAWHRSGGAKAQRAERETEEFDYPHDPDAELILNSLPREAQHTIRAQLADEAQQDGSEQ
ncbi:hypothetical protein [Streptomyces sp. NPDC059753]|uniref:hypothetical protein n=1 Tax=Streptomyces sp. NPDC059753 TaxID=3346933 RepID=UPI003651F3E5